MDDDPDRILAACLASFREVGPEPFARRRGMLVLDGRDDALAAALEARRFGVVASDALLDPRERQRVASQRVVVTARTPAFLDAAPVDEFGIIGLEALGDAATAEVRAEVLSDAFRAFSLGDRRAAWVLVLHPRGAHAFRWIA